jgi:hypothetical protein
MVESFLRSHWETEHLIHLASASPHIGRRTATIVNLSFRRVASSRLSAIFVITRIVIVIAIFRIAVRVAEEHRIVKEIVRVFMVVDAFEDEAEDYSSHRSHSDTQQPRNNLVSSLRLSSPTSLNHLIVHHRSPRTISIGRRCMVNSLSDGYKNSRKERWNQEVKDHTV